MFFIGSLNYVPSINTKENISFKENYVKNFGRIPSEFAVQGYDTGKVIIEAIKAVSGDISNKDKLAMAISKASIIGPRGPLTIDPKSNNVIQNIYIFEVVEGKSGPELEIIETISSVKDPGTGCSL